MDISATGLLDLRKVYLAAMTIAWLLNEKSESFNSVSSNYAFQLIVIPWCLMLNISTLMQVILESSSESSSSRRRMI